ncbi:Low molecular weight protein-tyrosine-phosphatase YfkJ [Pelagimonas phthalicica]|uniref:protein-tyrosine-phosphatase n=1 Tax=Pelagimonas phthalicica TaxID=1037362 RepID=A0A238JFD1_9RHOB|nr:low molecular weight protein-tyrosine-phosphatase [Pelagimonas phthalicica]TDS92340.1 protein-tyrosine phosphatase [Pelagimonas phthalicica]SMX29401.1 Low molecular weight protein-tyrosine-phosphatase YfkJ [Pelagimonas phthalicica]
MTRSILFVCLGNICRSPSAEAVTRAKALARDLPLELDSAGTGAWHVGEPPYGAMQVCAAKRGYDLAPLRARQVTAQDFERFDLIVAMDADNLRNLQDLAPNSARAKLALFTDFAPQTGADHVPDPYYTRDFDGTLDLVEICADALLDQL